MISTKILPQFQRIAQGASLLADVPIDCNSESSEKASIWESVGSVVRNATIQLTLIYTLLNGPFGGPGCKRCNLWSAFVKTPRFF